ncbi:hypothetical protein BDN70DRAFT_875911 [Pholiota conissans]|uniref:Uncharacterized protein n=1 Tax=Pholiota conissans TaxID=109636 RepID=A0A9P5Z630_9AGAR|nr:hypothetical protein BDN70DRAFT_875911 [Pholiota conissans]
MQLATFLEVEPGFVRTNTMPSWNPHTRHCPHELWTLTVHVPDVYLALLRSRGICLLIGSSLRPEFPQPLGSVGQLDRSCRQ